MIDRDLPASLFSFRNGSVLANFTVTYVKVDTLQVILLQQQVDIDGRIGTMPLTETQLAIENGVYALDISCVLMLLQRNLFITN